MIDKSTAEHYLWGQGCDGWHLVKTDALSVIEEQMPPGSSEVRHRHTRSRQFFYVLAGEATFELDGATRMLMAGQGIEVPPGVAHQIANRSSASLEFLVISTPPGYGDRIPA